MCGITGSINISISEEMLNLLNHRGPDSKGLFNHTLINDNVVYLGHTRLSILDLTDAGAQPMISDCKNYVLVFNGEIYNHLDLRKKLSHINFKGTSDTETILYYIREFGIESISDFNGIFALGFFDITKQLIYVARDRWGVKPLYYSIQHNKFIFSSELKLIFSITEIKEINNNSVDHFLSLRYNPAPETLIKNINKLEPGSYLTYTVNSHLYNKKKFYTEPPQQHHDLSESNALEGLDFLLNQAVQRQLLSDVPIGLLLSGGLDSALLGSLMSRYTSYKLNSYTVGFEGSTDYDELSDARISAEFIGTNHHEEYISKKSYFNYLEKSFFHTEEPISEPTIPALFHVSSMAAKDVKVVFSGQGADEPMAGYKRYKGEFYISRFEGLINLIPSSLLKVLKSHKAGLSQLIHTANYTNQFDRFLRIFEIFKNNEKNILYNKEMLESIDLNFEYLFRDLYHSSKGLHDSLNRLLYIDTRSMLPDNLLLFNDKITMACSLENRVPFLDNDLVNFIERMPVKYKIKDGKSKYLLRKMAARYLPYSIINRKKRGFNTPFSVWLKDPTNGYFLDLIKSSGSFSSQKFNLDFIEQMLVQYRNGHNEHFKKLYTIFSLEMWYINFYKKF